MKTKQETRMITDDGGLKITIGPKEVTWFRFLQISRTTNSLNGGWNSKSHWRKGLKSLGCKHADFLKDWTTNSLAPQEAPAPRGDNFMFDRDRSRERHQLNHGPLRKGDDLCNLSENELNTRLFHDNGHDLWGQNIGYEIPLSAESEGQLKVDIVAIGKDNHSLEIIELKQANNKGDSPLMAMTEAICYGIQAIRCRGFLLKQPKLIAKLVPTEHLKRIRLIVAAPN